MTRCKVGDLVYLVQALLPENIGKTGQIISADDHPLSDYSHGPRWILRPSALTRSVQYDGAIVTGAPFTSSPDAWLRPISGVPVDDETPTVIETPIATNMGAQGWM